MRKAYDNDFNRAGAKQKIIRFLSLIVTFNNFVFIFLKNLQIMGHTMGAIFVSAYANIFMEKFEKHVYPYAKIKSILYL